MPSYQSYVEAPHCHPVAVARYDESHSDGILQLDREVSGEDRAALFVGNLLGSRVCVSDGVVVGSYAPRLGEGLIVASDSGAGVSLMGQRLKQATRAALPTENSAGINALIAAGYTQSARATRMVLGEPFIRA